MNPAGVLLDTGPLVALLSQNDAIRCAEIHEEARILTFDTDFTVYKWARNRKFDLLESR